MKVGYARVSTRDQGFDLQVDDLEKADCGKIYKEVEGLQNQVLCLNLLANCVIVWNSVYMYEALEQLQAEGYQLSAADLQTHLTDQNRAHYCSSTKPCTSKVVASGCE